MPASEIQYSEKYFCKNYEYRHVILPADLARKVPRTHLMTETEWRNLGVQQSPGWIHFMIHDPEPHVLLFRRVHQDYKNNVQWACCSKIDKRSLSKYESTMNAVLG